MGRNLSAESADLGSAKFRKPHEVARKNNKPILTFLTQPKGPRA